jgi:nucleotide-binding universal stress UspA family protein
MQLPRHILVATDFSEASQGALESAAAFSTPKGARITLVHVFDPTPMVPPAAIPAPRRMEQKIEHELGEKVQAELEAIRTRELADVAEVEVLPLKHPNPAHAICDQAGRTGVDLVIVGTHGRTGLPHLFIGSVAERVVRHAPCPVLAVRHKDAHGGQGRSE